MADKFLKEVAPKYDEINLRITALQRSYMKAQLELNKGSRIFPDANSTLRVAYGKVEGYEPKDGAYYHFYTTLDGVAEKYIPGDREYDVPEKLMELYFSKDYGQYGYGDKMPVCFIASNHSTGGNSGSPVLNGNGELIGLAFDGNIEAMAGDVIFDTKLQRTINVDIRYVLWLIDKFSNAKHIVDELTIVAKKESM